MHTHTHTHTHTQIQSSMTPYTTTQLHTHAPTNTHLYTQTHTHIVEENSFTSVAAWHCPWIRVNVSHAEINHVNGELSGLKTPTFPSFFSLSCCPSSIRIVRPPLLSPSLFFPDFSLQGKKARVKWTWFSLVYMFRICVWFRNVDLNLTLTIVFVCAVTRRTARVTL